MPTVTQKGCRYELGVIQRFCIARGFRRSLTQLPDEPK